MCQKAWKKAAGVLLQLCVFGVVFKWMATSAENDANIVDKNKESWRKQVLTLYFVSFNYIDNLIESAKLTFEGWRCAQNIIQSTHLQFDGGQVWEKLAGESRSTL